MVWDTEWCEEDRPNYRGDEMTEQIPTTPVISNVTAIKKFFENGGRKVEMAEMKALTIEDREELGKLCIEELKKQNQ